MKNTAITAHIHLRPGASVDFITFDDGTVHINLGRGNDAELMIHFPLDAPAHTIRRIGALIAEACKPKTYKIKAGEYDAMLIADLNRNSID